MLCAVSYSQSPVIFRSGELWPDDQGVHINAHGGGILYHNDTYYWFGEHKAEDTNAALVGVTCYSSKDLSWWKNEGVALSVVKDDTTSVIREGCTIERPKVIFNKKTGKFVMYFHLELKGKGYSAAQTGIAVSDNVTGPYRFLKSLRPNAGIWPVNMTKEQRTSSVIASDIKDRNSPAWDEAIKEGLFVRRDFKVGQMSRDMTLYVDDDEKAYHIYASEENKTLHISELTDDYLNYTGKYYRVAPAGWNEAPALFKKDGRYFMITSGCTGWRPNAARLHTADKITGPWTEHSNPCVGKDSDLTFNGQSTYILPVQHIPSFGGDKGDVAFIFMADRWMPKHPIDGRYIWLPIVFENGLPVLKWYDKWELHSGSPPSPPPSPLKGEKQPQSPLGDLGAALVWSDEFDNEGAPNPDFWSYEQGFVRNKEFQWYQPDNANCHNGILTITGKKEQIFNPNYEEGSTDWRKNRNFAEYSAACIKTVGKKEFLYGRFEVRAKIPTASGSWPAIWTLGKSMPWPSNGEIDIMEYYPRKGIPHILANVAWGTDTPGKGKWNTKVRPFSEFTDKDPDWADKFHVWRMDWNEEAIRLYLDDELLNETFLKDTQNGSLGNYTNPFKQPHYILLNLAIGGQNGGTPDDAAFPLKYEIDYVRVYQK
jgi:beta-glucanase (GH16 family)